MDEFAKKLSPVPVGLGKQIDNREFWNRFKASAKYPELLDYVKELSAESLPCPGREIFIKDWESGSAEYQNGMNTLFKRNLKLLTMAECAENSGQYLDRIEQTIKMLCEMPTWTPPGVTSYFCDSPEPFLSGARSDIDLQVAHLATELATTFWMLKEHLAPDILELVVENLRKRIFEPFKLALSASPDIRHDWVFRNSNWNAVCLSGVLIPALTVLNDVKERAFYLAAVECSVEYYINSFTVDGFLDEGLSYWGYGMRYFLLMNEIADINTGGKFHWLVGDHIFKMVSYAAEIELDKGVFCSYADSVQGENPYYPVLAYVSRKYGLEITEWEKYSAPEYWDLSYLDCSLLLAPPCRKLERREMPCSDYTFPAEKARSWFPVGGMFVCRPGNSKCRLGISIKGGNNGTPSQITEWSHKHLDLGSFEIALDGEKPVVDPGVMRYDNTTFSKGRWEIPVHNSYGHNLPVLGGFGQREGEMARAKILFLESGDERDMISLDLTSAYSVPELIYFNRQYIYDRNGDGMFTVIDRVEFTEPQAYSAALMTYGEWKQTENGLIVTDKQEPLNVDIDCGELEYEIYSEVIPVDMRIGRSLSRISIALKQESKSILFKINFHPGQITCM
jgi:hypothetical protein